MNFDEITLNFKNLFPNNTFFQLFNTSVTFASSNIFYLVGDKQTVGELRMHFLNNKLRANVIICDFTSKSEILSYQNLIFLQIVLSGKYGNLIGQIP